MSFHTWLFKCSTSQALPSQKFRLLPFGFFPYLGEGELARQTALTTELICRYISESRQLSIRLCCLKVRNKIQISNRRNSDRRVVNRGGCLEVNKRFSLHVSGFLWDDRAANRYTLTSYQFFRGARNMKKKQPMIHSPLYRRLLLSRGIIQIWRAI